MSIVLGSIFTIATLSIFHSYVLFPMQMKRLARKQPVWPEPTDWPELAILMAAYNEEAVVEAKIRSVFNSQYPPEKIHLYVGSDASTDNTNAILGRLTHDFPGLQIIFFEKRTGKPVIINELARQCSGEILIITDADALFDPHCLSELVRPFSNPRIGGVQANTRISMIAGDTVAKQEASYTRREMEIKAGEGVWGAVIGGFGSAYALRKNLFRPVPTGFIVDDFYTFADISGQGYQTVFSREAITELRVSADSAVQFRRKRRIGKGNFQNLRHFTGLLNPFRKIGYVYWSHKVLRWFTPFLILAAYLSSGLAMEQNWLYWAFLGMNLAFLLALLDLALQYLGISVQALRFLGHFLRMNVALLLGFFDSFKNNQKVSWENKGNTTT
ncbi:MAG: glycosyltransferase [Bacteroidia bacterium]